MAFWFVVDPRKYSEILGKSEKLQFSSSPQNLDFGFNFLLGQTS